MDEIYLIYINADLNEGRGPMVHAKNTGFFTSEVEAWKVANTLTGVQGRKSIKGNWKLEEFGDVQVREIQSHQLVQMAELQIKYNKIQKLQEEVRKLQLELDQMKV